METLLEVLMKDAQAAKFGPIRTACQNALDTLNNKEEVERIPAFQLREKCLEPLHLALESRTKRLTNHAIAGIEKILKDERLQSSMESESEDKWLPIQILNTVYSTPNLTEEVQVEIMKLLLKMTFSTAWCMNARIITKVSQVYIDTYCHSSHAVKGVVQAALTQLLGSFAEKLHSAVKTGEHDGDDVLSDFDAKGNPEYESLVEDIVTLLGFLTDKVVEAQKAGYNKQAIPLLLEGLHAILVNSSDQLRDNAGFQELVWKSISPTLMSLLGLPKGDNKLGVKGVGKDEMAPNLTPATAKIIYLISVDLAKKVGPVRSLRPVLESLFHRILLCPAPQNRLDALKAIRELLSSPEFLCGISVTHRDNSDGAPGPTKHNDLALIKLMVDSVEECCHSNESAVCCTSVACVDDLLCSLEQLSRGVGIDETSSAVVLQKYKDKKDGKFRNISERSESVSSVTSDLGTTKAYEGSNLSDDTDELNKNKSEPDYKMKDGDNDAAKHHGRQKSDLTKLKVQERQSAVDFIEELVRTLPYLLQVMSTYEVDETLQKLASEFSARMAQQDQSSDSAVETVLNADSVYSTSYAALGLCLQLETSDFYQTGDKSAIMMSEKQFIESILDTDMFLYLSPDWLSHVYKIVLSRDLLCEAGWKADQDGALITALKEMDSSGVFEWESMSHRDGVFDEEMEGDGQDTCRKTNIEAGKLLSRQILFVCWEGVLDVLSVLLNGKSNCGITSSLAVMIRMEGAKEESMRAREAMCKCLDGLQKAAKLCCLLGLQQRCGAVFSQLANTSCVMEDFKHAQSQQTEKGNQKSAMVPSSKPKLVRLHAAHVLSMDAMMTTALEIGSHSSDCWKHVFRCCAFISELEHTYFSSGNNQSSLPRIHQEQTGSAAQVAEDDETELYGVPMNPIVPVAPRINVPNLIRQSSIESGWDRSMTGGGVLNSTQASQALCGLSQEVDRLFEEAADQLSISALATFLSELCEASKTQLHKINIKIEEEAELPGDHPHLPVNSLHLYRLQNVLMKVVRSGRPLIHLLKIWSVVSSYLVEAAGHKDRSISKMAVTCVHDYIIAAMSCHSELPHFHSNEMLCKTFENILCLELCDGDVQDQIVCSICELVEVSAAEIRSGWRPLFGALRAVRIEYTTIEEVNEARQRHVEAVLDVFDVYLNTDNILVFANATVDCILCLLKYVRGPGEFEDSDTSDSDSVNDYMLSSPESENLCIPALQYLKQCSIILQSMWKMPACPVFHGAHRIQVDSSVQSVDPHIPNMDFNKFVRYFITEDTESQSQAECEGAANGSEVTEDLTDTTADLHVVDEEKVLDGGSLTSADSGIIDTFSKAEPVKQAAPVAMDMTLTLEDLDNQTGILHVWFLMLEGLSGALSACPKSYQPQTMESLFELLRSASQVPGPKFGVYCMNHLLLPMLQSWLRSGSRKYGYWDVGATNFKQCCGHTTDLVVDMIQDFTGDTTLKPYLESVLQQLLIVLTECIAQPFEVISRLGCSCIRHVILSAGDKFSNTMWQIVTDGLEAALEVTTYSLRQLMTLFKANSENFYGDIGQVKVATRKDCSPVEFVRMWHLAQQVFLLDSQVSVNPPAVDMEEDKSYVFLLYPPGYENSINPDHILARIPFRNIIVGLLSHQLLLQTIGCILLENHSTATSQSSALPGMLSKLSTEHVIQLLDCLRSSYKLACDFDLRPGLKFLVQKVAHTEVAVNLYKQAGASMVFYIHTLIKICSNIPSLTLESVRTLLSKENRESQTGSKVSSAEIVNETGAATSHENTDKLEESDKVKSLSDGSLNELNVKDSGAINETISSKNKSHKTAENLQLEAKVSSSQTKKLERRSESHKPYIHGSKVIENPSLFVSQLQSVCNELCQCYIDILYDKAGTSCVDNMADQQLFFLIAQPDDFPEMPKKPDLSGLSSQLEQTQARLQGLAMTQPVSVQDDDSVPVSPKSPEPENQSNRLPVSPKHEPVKSKRQQRQEQESRVYNLATDKLIKNLMTEYKKRKHQTTMPSFVKVNKKKKNGGKKQKRHSIDPVEEVIEEQQKSSIMKDSEAHLQSWSELLCTILGLFHQLSDDQFKLLLPTVFSCVNHLICHAQDMRLREELAQWLHRVGGLFTLMADC